MIKRYTLTMALLGLFVLIPGNQPSSARNVIVNSKESAGSLDGKRPIEEYYKWRENVLGKKADKVPHFTFTAVTKRLSDDKGMMMAAVSGKIFEGYSATFQPMRIGPSRGQIPNYIPFGEPFTITVGFSAGEKVSKIEEIPGMNVVVPLGAEIKLVQVRFKFDKDLDDPEAQNDKKKVGREMVFILPFNYGESAAYTYGMVEGDDVKKQKAANGVDGGDPTAMGFDQFDDTSGLPCTPPCKFFSIYGGPGGCAVAKCCLDYFPSIMDADRCFIFCWGECWMPPNI